MLSRAFKGREKSTITAASVPQQAQPQPRRGKTLGEVMKEKDEELALFLEMRRREMERQTALLGVNAAQELDSLPPPGSKPGSSPLFKIASSASIGRSAPDDFLSSDGHKNDYDWLLTPPGTPLFPFLDKEIQRSPVGHAGAPKSQPNALKSMLSDPREPSAKDGSVSRPPASSSFGPGGTRRTLTGGLPALPAASKGLRPATPTSRAAPTKSAAAAPPRSSTPAARASTPTSRPSAVAPSRVSSRSATTPTRRPSTPLKANGGPAPPGLPASATRLAVAAPAPKGTTPAARPRAGKLSEMPGFSSRAPPNLKTAMPERPSSASRSRPRAQSTSRASSDTGASIGARMQCSSPARGRGGPNGAAVSRDGISPVVIGSKMVERVVNLRRLAPPSRQNGPLSQLPGANGRSASLRDGSGFGRSLSKTSLDMAMRHMDIRRSMPASLRPLVASAPPSSLYGVRTTGPARSRSTSTAESPLATRSNASSSERSVSNSNKASFFDLSGLDDENGGEMVMAFPAAR